MTNDVTTGLGYPRNPGSVWLRKESVNDAKNVAGAGFRRPLSCEHGELAPVRARP